MDSDKSGELASRIARKEDPPPQLRILRWISCVMLGTSMFFYVIGSDALRGKAVIGFIAALMGIGASYLLDLGRGGPNGR